MVSKLKEYLSVITIALVGALIVALRIQGSRLHKAKLDLLKEQLARETEKQDGNVAEARRKFRAALAEYNKHQ